MTGKINATPRRHFAVSTNVVAMKNGNDPGFTNIHEEALFEYIYYSYVPNALMLRVLLCGSFELNEG